MCHIPEAITFTEFSTTLIRNQIRCLAEAIHQAHHNWNINQWVNTKNSRKNKQNYFALDQEVYRDKFVAHRLSKPRVMLGPSECQPAILWFFGPPKKKKVRVQNCFQIALLTKQLRIIKEILIFLESILSQHKLFSWVETCSAHSRSVIRPFWRPSLRQSSIE